MTECMVCGCTDQDACADEATGETCAWVELEPGVTAIGCGGLCSFCAEHGGFRDPPGRAEFARLLHAALDRGLNKPTDSERDAPLVELVSDAEADRFLRARRAGA